MNSHLLTTIMIYMRDLSFFLNGPFWVTVILLIETKIWPVGFNIVYFVLQGL